MDISKHKLLSNMTETGWLVERVSSGTVTGTCIGVSDSGKFKGINMELTWTTPAFALRFSRKSDADLFGNTLNVETKSVEHQWG